MPWLNGATLNQRMTAKDYHWQRPSTRPRRRGDSRLGFWVMLAMVLSLATHGILWVLFDGIPVDDTEKYVLTEPFRIKQVTMDAEVVAEIVAGNEIQKPAETPPNDSPESGEAESLAALSEVSVEDIASLVANDSVRLTPGSEALENPALYGGDNLPGGASALDLAPDDLPSDLEPSMADLDTEMSSLDPDHPTIPENIDVDELSTSGADGLNDALSQSGGDVVPDGFVSLDDVLGMKGGGDPGKPIWVPTDVLFEFNSAALKEEARLSLMKLGALIMRRKDSDFVLEGHTDLFGGESYNRELSRNRALAIRNWLVDSLRLDADRIKVIGHGKAKPLVLSGTVEEQAKNRRVEVTITPHVTKAEIVP